MKVNKDKIVELRDIGLSFAEIGRRHKPFLSRGLARYYYLTHKDKYHDTFFWRLMGNFKRFLGHRPSSIFSPF